MTTVKAGKHFRKNATPDFAVGSTGKVRGPKEDNI
jgi:hypothetical protein